MKTPEEIGRCNKALLDTVSDCSDWDIPSEALKEAFMRGIDFQKSEQRLGDAVLNAKDGMEKKE